MPTARRVDGPQQSAFEIERFGFDGDARLEVSGRWFGVRGRNFVRPVLTVDVGGEPRRLVALLDHEPWNAADGERWIAAFPWEGPQEAVGPAVLEVGSLNVDLPVPGAESGVAGSVQHRPSRRPAPVAPWGDDAPPPPPRRSGERHTRVMPPRGPKETPAGLAEPDVDSALERALAAARAEALRLRERYESNAEALRAGERADEAQASL